MYIGSEINFHFILCFMKLFVCFYTLSLGEHNEFHKTSYEMKIHFRFFLSYDNSKKKTKFNEIIAYFEEITRENRPPTSRLGDVILLLYVTSRTKKCEISVKRVI